MIPAARERNPSVWINDPDEPPPPPSDVRIKDPNGSETGSWGSLIQNRRNAADTRYKNSTIREFPSVFGRTRSRSRNSATPSSVERSNSS